MAVALRTPYIAYVLRACLLENMLDDDDARLLLDTVERHAVELSADELYSVGHNHGLFQDEALYILATQLPVLAQASDWKALALTRLNTTLNSTICTAEGGHLEHSSSYQFAIAILVARLAENIPEIGGLSQVAERLKAISRWHVTPAGRMPQLGDTDDIPAPRWACDGAPPKGIKALFDTGLAFVRDGKSYLAVTAAHHGVAHKHADDTGFLLIEGGQIILGDTGRRSYQENEPDRVYARSAAAHNVLTVDHLDLPWRQTEPYGSGLVATGNSGRWYAVLARNPTLLHQGVRHRRLLLYQPGRALIVADEVSASESHDYVRYFHFGPSVTASYANAQVALSGDRISASFADLWGSASLSLHRGIETPQLLGWNYPNGKARIPVSTAVLLTPKIERALLVATLRLAKDMPALTDASNDGDGFSFAFADGQTIELELVSSDRHIRISRPGPA